MSTTRSHSRKEQAISTPDAQDHWHQTTLILAAHGSETEGATDNLDRLAERLRQQGMFRTVHAAYVKSTPSLEETLKTIDTGSVLVIPMFLANGYYTDKVIPEIVRQSPRITHVSDPIGTTEEMPALIEALAAETAAREGYTLEVTSILLIAHGSKRSKTSSTAAEHVAKVLAGKSPFRDIRICFLEEDPKLSDIEPGQVSNPTIIVPFLIAAAEHLKEITAFVSDLAEKADAPISITNHIGASPQLADLVVSLAQRSMP